MDALYANNAKLPKKKEGGKLMFYKNPAIHSQHLKAEDYMQVHIFSRTGTWWVIVGISVTWLQYLQVLQLAFILFTMDHIFSSLQAVSNSDLLIMFN